MGGGRLGERRGEGGEGLRRMRDRRTGEGWEGETGGDIRKTNSALLVWPRLNTRFWLCTLAYRTNKVDGNLSSKLKTTSNRRDGSDRWAKQTDRRQGVGNLGKDTVVSKCVAKQIYFRVIFFLAHHYHLIKFCFQLYNFT